MNKLNVLSVDWDYFVKADMNTRYWAFPDGLDHLSEFLQNMIWMGKYAGHETLTKIGIKKKAYNTIKSIISTIPKGSWCGVHDSHAHMVEFVQGLSSEFRPNEIDIYNVDFHHDLYSLRGKDGYDCGNWFTYLLDSGVVNSGVWVRDKESDMGEKEKAFSQVCGIKDTVDLESLKKIKFDAVFLCRSNPWSPPHLDNYFSDLVNYTLDTLGLVFGSDVDNVLESRYNSDFKKSVISERSVLEQFKELNSNLVRG